MIGYQSKKTNNLDFSNINDSEDIKTNVDKFQFSDRVRSTDKRGYRYIPINFDFSNIPVQYDNSTWVIRHFHDLLTFSVTLPENVTLKFEGGRISNGTIIGDNTKIEANLVKIFDTNVFFSGDFNVQHSFSEWFGAISDGITDNTISLQKTFDSNLSQFVKFPTKGTYMSDQLIIRETIVIDLGQSTLKLNNNFFIPDFQGFLQIRADNVIIKNGTIDGNKENQNISIDHKHALIGGGTIPVANSTIYNLSKPTIKDTNLNNFKGGGVHMWQTVDSAILKNITSYLLDAKAILFSLPKTPLQGPKIIDCYIDQKHILAVNSNDKTGIGIGEEENATGYWINAEIRGSTVILDDGNYTTSQTTTAVHSVGGRFSHNYIYGGSIAVTVKFQGDTIISNNVILNSQDYGIEITSGTAGPTLTTISNIVVSGNTVDGSKYSTYITNGVVKNISITSNTFLNSEQGIHVLDSEKVVISGNSIKDCTAQGIVIRDSSEVVIANCYLSADSNNTSGGIEINNSNIVSINNVIINSFQHALRFSTFVGATTIDNILINNLILNSIKSNNYSKASLITLGDNVLIDNCIGLNLFETLYNYKSFKGDLIDSIISFSTNSAPTVNSAVGSIAINKNGSSGSVLYVKEGVLSTDWRAI